MPYIPKENRTYYDACINKVFSQSYQIPIGELNYFITRICVKYLDRTKKNYVDYNTIIGMLECVKQEFYRRQVSVYEDRKKQENGDAY